MFFELFRGVQSVRPQLGRFEYLFRGGLPRRALHPPPHPVEPELQKPFDFHTPSIDLLTDGFGLDDGGG